jgi:hypothetical protein
MLSKAVLKAIGTEVDEVFDRISDRFLGTKYVPHGIEFKVMTLEDFFKDIAEREGIDPDKDSLSTLKDIAESYLDSARERAKAQVTQSIQQVMREAILTGDVPNIEVALEGALTKVWGDVTTHVHTILDSEINTARNVSIMEGITEYNASIGVDDPIVFFVIVRDNNVCSECIRLHMMPDGVTPRVWKLSEVGSGYHKKGDPNPKISGLHPHCRCIMTTLLPNFGFNSSGMVTFIGNGHDEFAKQRGMAKSEGLVKSTTKTLESGLWDQIKQYTTDKHKRLFVGGDYSIPTNDNIQKDIIDRSPIAVHFPIQAIDAVSSSGRLKNQFETKRSGGDYDPARRVSVERSLFGIPRETEEEQRPVYGALHYKMALSHPSWHIGPTDGYGNMWFELHPHVKDRTTYTNGDSFGSFHAIPPHLVGHHGDINKRYLEAQIHGGVYLDKDVKAIHARGSYSFPEDNEDIVRKVKALAQKYNIPAYFHHVKEFNQFSHTEPVHTPSASGSAK